MADRMIKTRDAVKGTIKTIDKAATAAERMKSAYAKTKDKAEQGYYADENSASEYATDRVFHSAERVSEEGVHQFNKQGQKSIQTTKDNIVKAKDKMADFKEKRALKAAEQKKAQLNPFPQIRQASCRFDGGECFWQYPYLEIGIGLLKCQRGLQGYKRLESSDVVLHFRWTGYIVVQGGAFLLPALLSNLYLHELF